MPCSDVLSRNRPATGRSDEGGSTTNFLNGDGMAASRALMNSENVAGIAVIR